MDFTPGQQKLLAYWGTIQSGVSQRFSTAALWEAVRNVATVEGVSLAGVSAIDMGRLRAIAAEQRNTMEAVQRSRPSDAITAEMIGRDLSARSAQEQILAPMWIARFEHDVTVNGELQTLWRSSVFEGHLPATVGEMRSALESDAAALADDYGVTHVGLGRFQIAAV